MLGRTKILLLAFLALLPVAWAQAQSPSPVIALTADRITYATGYRTLTASGNVEILYGTIHLTAISLEFDQQNDIITIQGPLVLTDGDTVTIVAEFARLAADLQDGILTGARMVLNQQLQISAVEINRSEGRYSQLFKAAASACTVSTLNPVPLWQIRARRIIHDQETKQLYFEQAQFLIGNVPVAFIPRLRLPDPTVRRATGFLVPEFTSSDTLGSGIGVPYFLTLGDYSDVTLTPVVTSKLSATLKVDFRRRLHNGALNFTGALSSDQLTSSAFRGYLFGDGNLRFANGVRAAFNLEVASDDAYLLQYGFSSSDRLKSDITVYRVQRYSYFGAEIAKFHSQFSTVSNDTIPSTLGDVSYRRRWSPTGLGGQLGVTLQSSGLYRHSTTDGVTGRDMTRASAQIDWSRNWLYASGLIFNTTGEFRADYFQVYDDTAYPSPILRTTPMAAATLRLPLTRSTGQATHMIEPAVQVLWSPDSATTVPNEDSIQAEFENSNLFALSRFSGSDMIERGLRANVGVSYNRVNAKGFTIGASVGQVFRASDLGQFSTASGLSGVNSGVVTAVAIYLPQRFKLVSRTLFNPQFGVSKNETQIKFRADRFDVATTYFWLDKDAVSGQSTDRSGITVDAAYALKRNWSSTANWRYDIVAESPSSASVALTYRNECIKVDLSLSRRFNSSTTVAASTSIGLTVALEGFGTRSDSQAYTRRCSDF